MGSLNFPREVSPLDRLQHDLLTLHGNKVFGRLPCDLVSPFPIHLQYILKFWLAQNCLASQAPWQAPKTQISVLSDASDTGWG